MLDPTPGQRMKRLRDLNGWTQHQLGREIGLGKAMISAYEKGHRITPPHKKVLDALDRLERRPVATAPNDISTLEKEVIALRAQVEALERLVHGQLQPRKTS